MHIIQCNYIQFISVSLFTAHSLHGIRAAFTYSWGKRNILLLLLCIKSIRPAKQSKFYCEAATGNAVRSLLWLAPSANGCLERIYRTRRRNSRFQHFFSLLVS